MKIDFTLLCFELVIKHRREWFRGMTEADMCFYYCYFTRAEDLRAEFSPPETPAKHVGGEFQEYAKRINQSVLM